MDVINGIILLGGIILVPMILGWMFFVGKLTYNFFMETNITFLQVFASIGFITLLNIIYKHFFIA